MKIQFIQTGGTIDKDYPKVSKGYAFEISKDESAMKRIIENIDPAFEYEIIPLLQKDSLEITDLDRKLIAKICFDSKYDKIIVTHGTDTMVESAKEVANLLINNIAKVIIFTGSIRPERFNNSDAHFNLGTAIGALNILKSGVFIAMNGMVYEYDNVIKNEETGQFESK